MERIHKMTEEERSKEYWKKENRKANLLVALQISIVIAYISLGVFMIWFMSLIIRALLKYLGE
jgi:hypothetical protein